MNIFIVGAGISGLSTALKLARRGHKVTIHCADHLLAAFLSSRLFYGMWWPLQSADDPLVELLTMQTLAEFQEIAGTPNSGVTMMRNIQLRSAIERPWFAEKLPFYRPAMTGEISSQYPHANVLDTAPVVDPSVYMPSLLQQVLELGVKIVENSKIDDIYDCPPGYDAYINCAGLGAPHLMNKDGADFYPVRIQVMTVKSKRGFDSLVWDEEGPNSVCCFVPQPGSDKTAPYFKIGAVVTEHEDSRVVDAQAARGTLLRVNNMLPELNVTESDVLEVTPCIRLKQPSGYPRLQGRRLDDGRPVFDNVAHSGCGVIMSLGIGNHIANWVETL